MTGLNVGGAGEAVEADLNWNPDGFDGSSACAGLGAKRFVCSEAAAGLLLIALAKMFEVAEAGGLNLGAAAEGWGVGVAGTSAGRARFVGEVW